MKLTTPPTSYPLPLTSSNLAVIILTGNEELHIERCLERLLPLEAKEIFVIDCFSKDKTVEKIEAFKQMRAEELGGCRLEVLQHEWPGCQALQLNWALDNAPITAEWVLRLDADEYLFPETCAEVRELLPQLDKSVTSLSLSLSRAWEGRILKHAGSDVILTRFFRFGKGRCEERLMDEHIQTTEGECRMLKGAFVDDNLNDLAWWTQKHVGYALREALDLLRIEFDIGRGAEGLNDSAATKRRLKLKYARLPLYWRALFYFVLRYFVKGGFLDGKAGWTWHFFQGLWYRMLVDARIAEIKRATGVTKGDAEAWTKICAYVERQYGLRLCLTHR